MKLILFLGSFCLGVKITHQAVNVAPRGRASQSAEPASAETGPDMAIDNYHNPNDSATTCASVPTQDNPWWQLDLMSIYYVTAVSVICDEHRCQEQLDGAEILIGLRNDTKNQRCAVICTAEGQFKYDYECEKTLARFVLVLLPGEQRNLTVCEVQVFGTVLENVALRGVAYQSSLRWRTTGKASNVIDGIQFTTCSLTQDQPGQWLEVDLLVPFNVMVIQLAFRETCCYEVEVHVDNTRCLSISSSSQSLMTLDCGGIIGRTVTVFHPDVPLTLCEVEIFSTLEHPENKFPQRPPSSDYCSFDYCSRDYIFIDDEPMTWFEAQTYCRQWYTDLAVIDSTQDMNRIVDKMNENNFFSFWIGLYEDVFTWRWSLSDEGYYENVEAEFRNWASGEPKDQTSILHCVGIRDTGEWQDLDCGLLHYFCCFDGRDDASEAKVLVQTPMNWVDAQQYCRERHTDLLSVRTSAENEEIQRMVPAGRLVWIGLFGDTWKWSDGRDSLFRYWQQGQPESSGTGSDCTYADGGAWRAQSCDAKSLVLCYCRGVLKRAPEMKVKQASGWKARHEEPGEEPGEEPKGNQVTTGSKEADYKKRSVVKISSDLDMCDPDVQQQIVQQLEAKMKNEGIGDFKIRWRMSGKQVLHNRQECVTSDGGQL